MTPASIWMKRLNTEQEQNYIFGPVPSRRLGRSLGIDPCGGPENKRCSFNCVYCEVGETGFPDTAFFDGPDPMHLAVTLGEFLLECPTPDFITVSGSGEPTLWSGLGSFLEDAGDSCSIPLAVITNSSTLHLPQVRNALHKCHVVVPTLNTVDETTFVRLHQPAKGLSAAQCAKGIRLLRQETNVEVWLEVMLIPGVNDDEVGLVALAAAIASINPHQVQIGTVDRPGRMTRIAQASPEKLLEAREILASSGVPTVLMTHVALPSSTKPFGKSMKNAMSSMLRLRWVRYNELAPVLGVSSDELDKELENMRLLGELEEQLLGEELYIRLRSRTRR